MKNQLTAHEVGNFEVSVVMLKWLEEELTKLSKRSVRDGEGSFMVFAQAANTITLFRTKTDSIYTNAAIELCEAAQRGEKIILNLPAPAASESSFVGEPGAKIEADVEIKNVYIYNGDFGITFIHKIVDTDKNELVWFSQGKKIEEGIYHMTAKVHKDASKAFTEYYGTKQTRVTHAKFEERREVKIASTERSVSDEETDNSAPF